MENHSSDKTVLHPRRPEFQQHCCDNLRCTFLK
jgi:hypothetical protein